MTTKEYSIKLEQLYPNTMIGFKHFFNTTIGDINKYQSVPLDYFISTIILYIEYRNVNFLEALTNANYDKPNISHNTLRLNTVNGIFNRMEKNILPIEGKQF